MHMKKFKTKLVKSKCTSMNLGFAADSGSCTSFPLSRPYPRLIKSDLWNCWFLSKPCKILFPALLIFWPENEIISTILSKNNIAWKMGKWCKGFKFFSVLFPRRMPKSGIIYCGRQKINNKKSWNWIRHLFQ